jgi:hypothetical protein
MSRSSTQLPSIPSSQGDKEKDEQKQQNQNALVLNETHAQAETRIAEEKVAWGIKYLYGYGQHLAEFDGQKIATITAERADLDFEVDSPFGRCKLADLFPNNLANGVTIHLFNNGAIQHPPAFYMAQQKIRSFCDAAKRPPLNLPATDEISQQIEAAFRAELEALYSLGAKDGSSSSSGVNVDAYHAGVNTLIKKYIQEVTEALHHKYTTQSFHNRAGFTAFSKILLESSTHHRSDTHDILTFNMGKKYFSYDEAANTTAHDRSLGSGCANLSLVFEGKYQDAEVGNDAADRPLIKTQITTSYVKHASPVAINAIGKATDSDLLLDTCQNMHQVIEAMVRLRLHGRSRENASKRMEIDWVYQILTTNVFNSENQSATYGYVTRAARLINQSQFTVGATPVNLEIGVLNAGINSIASLGQSSWLPDYIKKYTKKIIPKADTQRRENRQAYLQLTNAVTHIHLDKINTICEPLNGLFDDLKKMLQPEIPAKNADAYAAQMRLQTIKQQIANISNAFGQLENTITSEEQKCARLRRYLEELQTNESPDSKTKLGMIIDLDNDIKKIEIEIPRLKEHILFFDAKATANYEEMVTQTNILEGYERKRWKNNREHVLTDISFLQDYLSKNINAIAEQLQDPVTGPVVAHQLKSISALIYKAYADELYYGDGKQTKYAEEYRKPEKAALFNAYLISYQHLTGMAGSIGCKSANDRTLILRLLIAALAARPVETQPLPEAHHNQASLKENQLIDRGLSQVLSDMAMNNAAIISCINDTCGGTAKASASKFPFMAGIQNLDMIGAFGEKYAAHKMLEKGGVKAPERASISTNTASSQRTSISGVESSLRKTSRSGSPPTIQRMGSNSIFHSIAPDATQENKDTPSKKKSKEKSVSRSDIYNASDSPSNSPKSGKK